MTFETTGSRFTRLALFFVVLALPREVGPPQLIKRECETLTFTRMNQRICSTRIGGCVTSPYAGQYEACAAFFGD